MISINVLRYLLLRSISKLASLVPKDRKKIVFWAPSDTLFLDNLLPIWQNIPKNYKKYCVSYTNIQPPYNLEIKCVPRYSLKGIWLTITAKYLITTYGPPRIKTENQVCIGVWHGIPIKTILGRKKDMRYSNMKFIDYFVTTSEIIADYFRLLGLMDIKYITIGMPRTDILFDIKKNPRLKSNMKRDILRELGIPNKYKRIIVYLPTFRDVGKNKTRDIAMQLIDNIKLPGDTALVIKMHEFEKTVRVDIKNDQVFVFPKNPKVRLYELLGVSDMLITDYSSVLFDYLITEKPIILYTPDIEEYKKYRGFILTPTEKWIPGPICQSVECVNNKVKELLSENIYKDKIIALRKLVGDKPNSSKKLFELFFR